MSKGQKEELTLQALGLLNEQVQARIIHYKGELETSPELDAVTAQVVAQLRAMQSLASGNSTARQSATELEATQIAELSRLLKRLLSERSNFASQRLAPVGRRIAKLFFESELHEKTKGDKEKVIHHAEQGVYYVLQRYKNRIRAELDGFSFANDDVKELTLMTLAKIERDLQVGFLSRRSPELNHVMTLFAAVLNDFLHEHLPPRVEQLARITIRGSRAAHAPDSLGYKVSAGQFADFRREWERVLMEQMVHFCGDELLSRLSTEGAQFRQETVRFFTDPQIFSESCEVLCDGIYDFLCLEGFLDVPADWRVSHESPD